MSTTTIKSEPFTFAPSESERVLARDSSRSLAELAGRANGKKSRLLLTVNKKTIPLPASLLDFLATLLIETARGNTVTLHSVHTELTTQQAADYLNVSRPYLVKLIEDGKIPHRKVGRRRRILFSNLQAYKRTESIQGVAAMDELARQAQALNMGY